jgi:hypothetical protein
MFMTRFLCGAETIGNSDMLSRKKGIIVKYSEEGKMSLFTF